jgi:hypothetical protein
MRGERRVRLSWIMPLLLVGAQFVTAADVPTQAARIPEIWFCPRQSTFNPSGHGVLFDQYDFPAMRRSTAQWKQALSHISVLTLDVVHDAEGNKNLSAIIDWANKLKLKIAGPAGIIYTDHRCNPRMEGITNDVGYAREAVATFHHWSEAGGRLDYLILDGPFFFGYYATQRECHFSIDDVAHRAATTVKMILQDFPNARIVDSEGPGPVPVAIWLSEYDRFLAAFRRAAGRPVDDLAMDMHWIDAWHTGYNWVDASRQIIQLAHARGLQVGLFIHADDDFVETNGAKTNQPITAAGWMQANRNHMQTAHDAGLQLDFINITSWMKYPTQNLPESDPNAYTSLVNYAYRLWSGGSR